MEDRKEDQFCLYWVPTYKRNLRNATLVVRVQRHNSTACGSHYGDSLFEWGLESTILADIFVIFLDIRGGLWANTLMYICCDRQWPFRFFLFIVYLLFHFFSFLFSVHISPVSFILISTVCLLFYFFFLSLSASFFLIFLHFLLS